jgi:hypothetical protein
MQLIRVLCLFSLPFLVACATGGYHYTPVATTKLSDRVVSQTEGGVSVSAAVPGEEEVEAIFGVPLFKRGIQPVWLRIENQSPANLRFMPVGTDKLYFSPLEVAYIHKRGFSKQARKEMEARFYELSMPRQIPSGESREGFVFTHASPGTKSFNVDVISSSADHTFSFFIDVPGFTPDHSRVEFGSLYAPADLTELDVDGFRSQLDTQSVCCTTNQDESRQGLPWNIVLVGKGQDLLQALMRAGWNETALQHEAEDLLTVQYLFQRKPDAVFRNQRSGNDDRNEMSLWLTPVKVDGIPVWVAQITHFIGQKTQLGTFIFGSRVDPDIDDSRSYLIQNLWYAQSLEKIAWVRTDHVVPIAESAEGFAGTDYFTDGFRAVLWLSGDPVSQTETISIGWEQGPTR